jgi:hypothetical protein
MKADYVETCNCDYGCPCNFSGFPTYGNCQALLLFHIRSGSYHTQPIVKNIIDNRRSGFGGMQYTSVRSLFSSVGGLYHMKALRQVFFSVLLTFQLNTP